jgi:hypothetical protein
MHDQTKKPRYDGQAEAAVYAALDAETNAVERLAEHIRQELEKPTDDLGCLLKLVDDPVLIASNGLAPLLLDWHDRDTRR